jgi:hypothetical protein
MTSCIDATSEQCKQSAHCEWMYGADEGKQDGVCVDRPESLLRELLGQAVHLSAETLDPIWQRMAVAIAASTKESVPSVLQRLRSKGYESTTWVEAVLERQLLIKYRNQSTRQLLTEPVASWALLASDFLQDIDQEVCFICADNHTRDPAAGVTACHCRMLVHERCLKQWRLTHDTACPSCNNFPQAGKDIVDAELLHTQAELYEWLNDGFRQGIVQGKKLRQKQLHKQRLIIILLNWLLCVSVYYTVETAIGPPYISTMLGTRLRNMASWQK